MQEFSHNVGDICGNEIKTFGQVYKKEKVYKKDENVSSSAVGNLTSVPFNHSNRELKKFHNLKVR